MATRIPHLLEPYLALPPECAQILLTSVLGASTNWLVLRYLYSYLRRPTEDAPADDTRVVLVSFMRDFAFWKEGAGRLGLDLETLGRGGKFVFVDGLSGLFSNAAPPPTKGRRTLRGAKIPDVQRELEAAVADVSGGGGKVVLVVDQPDFLLAATGEEVGGLVVKNMLLDLQEKVHASIEHASFVLGLAHAAEMVVGLRLLDTGTARDVSGVLRVTAGGNGERTVEEAELLYFVGGDGSVKVFGRGQ
uniref:Elongator complex protein 6 n=1 Tax=Colletotrichum fructicola (strain Nara gc5) TaxID=1213859 RepID=L2FMN0_COLFN